MVYFAKFGDSKETSYMRLYNKNVRVFQRNGHDGKNSYF